MENLQAQMVLEVMGRPPENVTQALNSVITKLGTEKGVKVLEHQVHDPVLIKDSDELYTAFVDATLEIESLEQYFHIIFAYMPSHAEIVYPEKIVFDNARINQFANQLAQRLHNYDAVTKKVLVERDIFLKKLKEKAPEVFNEVMASAFRTHDSETPPEESKKKEEIKTEELENSESSEEPKKQKKNKKSKKK